MTFKIPDSFESYKTLNWNLFCFFISEFFPLSMISIPFKQNCPSGYQWRHRSKNSMSSVNSLPNLVNYYFIYENEVDLSIAFLENIHLKIKL